MGKQPLAAEYRTLLQVRRYVRLADEPKFVKGPKWKDIQKDAVLENDIAAEIPEENPHSDRNTPTRQKTQNRKLPGRLSFQQVFGN